MREVQAAEAKTKFLRLLDEVEQGESISITRHGKRIARIIPEREQRQSDVEKLLAEIDDYNKDLPKLTLEEILSARHEGHKY